MASLCKFSYHRLRFEGDFDEEVKEESVFRKIRKWPRSGKFTVIRRRPKLRIPGLRRFLKKKRVRFFTKVRVSLKKAMKRLKNGQVHLNDLFGGNYLLMQLQVNPSTSLRCGDRTFMPSRYYPGKIA